MTCPNKHPEGPVCPTCGGSCAPSGVDRGSWVHFPVTASGRVIERLAIEGHGAIQVDESPDREPPIIVLAGPIKFWWQEGQWDSLRHQEYVQWRDAVRVALVKAGFAVYSPQV